MFVVGNIILIFKFRLTLQIILAVKRLQHQNLSQNLSEYLKLMPVKWKQKYSELFIFSLSFNEKNISYPPKE